MEGPEAEARPTGGCRAVAAPGGSEATEVQTGRGRLSPAGPLCNRLSLSLSPAVQPPSPPVTERYRIRSWQTCSGARGRLLPIPAGAAAVSYFMIFGQSTLTTAVTVETLLLYFKRLLCPALVAPASLQNAPPPPRHRHWT